MKKLRALQDTQIQTPRGPRFVRAEEVVDVPDDFFEFHPLVLEEVREVRPARGDEPAVYTRVQPRKEGA